MSSKWVIKDAGGNITNPCITAEESFVAENFEYYEAYTEATPTVSAAVTEKLWRNEELIETDMAAQTPDWPNRDNIIIYRAALRAWPASSDFPATKPVLGT